MLEDDALQEKPIDLTPDMPYRAILGVTDFSLSGDKMLVHAIRMARAFGSVLYVLHVLPPRREPEERVMEEGQWERSTDTGSQEAFAASDAILELLARHEAIGHPVIRRGEMVSAVLATIEDLGAEVVVMASSAESGLLGMFKPTPAEQVSRRARCPVVLVH